MKSQFKTGLTALAMGFIAVGRLAANDPMTEKLKTLKGEEFDHKFVSHMIEHHQQGIEMASLAQQRAQRSEIKQFAQKTAAMQQKDIEKLKGFPGGKTSDNHASAAGKPRAEETGGATSHTGTSHTNKSSHTSGTSHTGTTSHEGAGAPTGRTSHGGTSHEAMKTESMSKLHSAQGAEFDRVFTEEMIKHHNMAIEMSQLAKSRASSSEVKQFAQKTVDEQTKEVDELKSFKKGSSR